jgi:hypothetical protein
MMELANEPASSRILFEKLIVGHISRKTCLPFMEATDSL